MKTKTCPRCKQELLINKFNHTPSRIVAYCKDCQREHQREYRNKNRDKYRAQKNRRRKKMTQKIKEFLNKIKDVPCLDCGNIFPPFVMDFHHRDPDIKKFTINKLSVGNKSIELLKEEIKKCDIICSNCHRIRHNKGSLC